MTPKILLLGGHGKVALLLTGKIVARSWSVTSVIRDAAQKDDILAAAGDGPGKVDVLVASLDDVKSEGDAKAILEKVKPDWVVWAAGELQCLVGGGGKEEGNIGYHVKLLSSLLIYVLVIGAGGKGGKERTYAIDRDAAGYFVR